MFGLYTMWSRHSGFKSGVTLGVMETLKKLTENKIILVSGNQISPYPTMAINADEYSDEQLDKLKKDIAKFLEESDEQIPGMKDRE